MASKQYVGRRQTDERALVNLYNWLIKSMFLRRWQATKIVNYVDERFVDKGRVDF